ncbi:4Fe-4S dicluster domain-containing protein [Desulfonispora thiosulfatigenes DSM 11270]|uniref:4Fe-4S dicluster domain-containing protein n=1 Tax=Desulfonispora thiosulfatigenes DSM 11270 TaxID=656914 RepID=A0A1W1UJD0_DESTI|nr:[Fe-Fe] hydrogenase large subunit C-terminal domain-containing protein [Desulfonispora thiosulfatigenes]SMB81187.1 4Fe-4S dicluster domain-containing protein [Desulfonispora thiosulfatigenes DSM 11270]
MGKVLVYTKSENCIGCNRCITGCPIPEANYATKENGQNMIHINPDYCIACGHCIEICKWNVRDYYDDTQDFFDSLKQGKSISIIVAPSIRTNFPRNYKRVLGFLKSKGIKKIYDTSFGAEITVWAYLKYITENNVSGTIAQPCPAVVNYIEKYSPELIQKLAPVHSPMMCAAVYMKDYSGITEELAFISPCVAKKIEIDDVNTKGYIKYNVTMTKLINYLKNNNINLDSFPEQDFDDPGYGLGSIFSKPGGLRENIEHHVPGALVRQVEGQTTAYKYLDLYKERVAQNKPTPLLIDILNCEKGCNYGTGTKNDISIDDTDFVMYEEKKNVINQIKGRFKKTYNLFTYFDKTLKLDSFKRNYTNKKIQRKVISNSELNQVFERLYKYEDYEKTIDCMACGYDTCKDMATAIFFNNNFEDNCVQYDKKIVERERKELQENNEKIQDMLEEMHAMNEEKEYRAKLLKENIELIYASLNELSHANTENVKDIDKISSETSNLFSSSAELRKFIDNIDSSIAEYLNSTTAISKITDDINLLSLNASIESARAGEHGQGFSVVAKEIGKLADNSKAHTESIDSNNQKILPILQNILGLSEELDKRIGQITEAVNNISGSIQEASAGTEQMFSITENIVEGFDGDKI